MIYRQKVVGIVTRQDLMQSMAQNPNWQTLKLSAVMSRPVITVTQTWVSVGKATPLIALLRKHQISHLPVVDEFDSAGRGEGDGVSGGAFGGAYGH